MKILENREELLNILPKNLECVELGVFLGDFSKEIYNICLPAKLYLVDIFPNVMTSGDKDGKNIKTLNIASVPNKLSDYFNDDNVIIIKSKTTDFIKDLILQNKSIDLVYIDADHSYEAVKQDLNLSYEIVKKGGFICGHDYTNHMFPDVVRAVDEFCLERGLTIKYLTKDGCPSYCIEKLK